MWRTSSWAAVGWLLLACASSGEESGPRQPSPPFVPGSSPVAPVVNGALPASGSNGPAAVPSEGAAAPSAAGTEPAGSLPLAGEPEPEGATTSAPGTTPPEAAPPGSPEPTGMTPADPEPTPPATPPAPRARLENVLVFTRTAGYRHGSIEPGVQALQRLGQENGFAVDRTEDPAAFTDERLARYDVVVWLNTDSDVMNDDGRRAFERYIRAGRGWVGVHAAAATEYGWAWYGQLLGGGAFFQGHPPVQAAQVNVEIARHPSTQHLPPSFTLQDEWYSFRANPRSSVRVLMTLTEASYGVGDLAMGDHPIAWYHEFDGGRAWYTALGHPDELYTDDRFVRHLLGGIRWAAGVAD